MPHIEIKCYPGRSEEEKRDCAEKVAMALAQAFGSNLSSISVSIKDVEKENWKNEVWDGQIMADEASLYKKPGYSM